MQAYQGIPASSGIAIGPIWVYRPIQIEIDQQKIEDTQAEWDNLEKAIELARSQLEAIEAKAHEVVSADEASIFSAHLLFLEDVELLDKMREMIIGQQLNAKAAVFSAFDHYAQALLSLEEEYFKARAQDVYDVRQRLLRCLEGKKALEIESLEEPAIVLAEDLTPSDTIQFDRELILGLATVKGGPTSHTAILARALGVPAVVSAPIDLDALRVDTLVILDGIQGEVIIDPSDETLKRRHKRQAEWQELRDGELSRANEPAITQDGHLVEVVANIGNREDARQAIAMGAEGVGLFRTEFLYLDRDSMPRLNEQVQAYREIFEVMAGKPVVVRTLDIGGDKAVSYLGLASEPNPFLGWRAIRMIRERPEVLEFQLLALMVAAGETKTDLRIMLPMVSTIGEIERAREIFESAKRTMDVEGRQMPEKIQFGIMVEVPSVAVLADQFAKYVDFFSIGTNDLTQYTLAIDRTNERVADLASPYNPAVLRLIHDTIQAAHAEGIWVGLCGEFAGDPMAAPFLLGVGLDEFSMAPSSVPTVKATIRSLSVTKCKELAKEAMSLPNTAEVIEFFRNQQGS